MLNLEAITEKTNASNQFPVSDKVIIFFNVKFILLLFFNVKFILLSGLLLLFLHNTFY